MNHNRLARNEKPNTRAASKSLGHQRENELDKIQDMVLEDEDEEEEDVTSR